MSPIGCSERLRSRGRHIECIFCFLFQQSTDVSQFIAKAFLEKDYEAIKARDAAPQPAEDVAMNDVDVDQSIAAQVQPPPPVEKFPSPEKVDLKKEETTVAEPQAPIPAIPDAQPSEEVPVKDEKEIGAAAPTNQGLAGAGAEGINFDSVLNTTGGANSFDLNLDFGNDDMGNQAFLSGSTFGNVPSGTEKPNVSMPVESTVPTTAGGGAFDMELQRTDGDPNLFPEQGTGTDEIMGPGESSFDDLFMESENFGEGGDMNQLEGDSLMNISELDDNWFT